MSAPHDTGSSSGADDERRPHRRVPVPPIPRQRDPAARSYAATAPTIPIPVQSSRPTRPPLRVPAQRRAQD